MMTLTRFAHVANEEKAIEFLEGLDKMDQIPTPNLEKVFGQVEGKIDIPLHQFPAIQSTSFEEVVGLVALGEGISFELCSEIKDAVKCVFDQIKRVLNPSFEVTHIINNVEFNCYKAVSNIYVVDVVDLSNSLIDIINSILDLEDQLEIENECPKVDFGFESLADQLISRLGLY